MTFCFGICLLDKSFKLRIRLVSSRLEVDYSRLFDFWTPYNELRLEKNTTVSYSICYSAISLSRLPLLQKNTPDTFAFDV